MIQIRFTKTAYSTAFGTFGPGDTLRCSEDAAKHFVADAQCAEIITPPAEVLPQPKASAVATPRRRRATPVETPAAQEPSAAAGDVAAAADGASQDSAAPIETAAPQLPLGD